MSIYKPTLSVIIPWCNRYEIIETLLHNSDFLYREDVEIIISNFGGDYRWLKENVLKLHIKNLLSINIPNKIFNKATAINMGVYMSKSPILFFLDCDIFLNNTLNVENILNSLSISNYITIEKVIESNSNSCTHNDFFINEFAYYTEITNKLGKTIKVETNRINLNNNCRSAPGLIILNKKHFLDIKGMNSNLKYWGWEDLDLLVRLESVLMLNRYQMGSVIHKSHDDSLRNLNAISRSQSEAENFSMCLANYSMNNYDGTYLEDVGLFNDINIQ